jgi:hypothetical protein
MLFHDNVFYVQQTFERGEIAWSAYWSGYVSDVREILVRFMVGARLFPSPERSDRLKGFNKSPGQWVRWASPPGVKRSKREADYLPSHSAEVKNGYCHMSSSPHVIVVCTGTNLNLYFHRLSKSWRSTQKMNYMKNYFCPALWNNLLNTSRCTEGAYPPFRSLSPIASRSPT